MTFSEGWEQLYKLGAHHSQYPWSDMVSLVMRYANPKQYDHKPRVLELGPGVGANVAFFLENGFEYYGIEGSETATNYMIERFGKSIKVETGDFTKSIPYDNETFDLIVDRAATTHNTVEGITNVIEKASALLVSKGLFIAVDWFSTRHPLFLSEDGTEIEPNTKTRFTTGTFKDVGIVHFFSENEIVSFFRKDFVLMHMEHKTYETLIPDRTSGVASYNIVARKIS